MPRVNDISRAVLDASVAVRWLVEETGSEAARAIVESKSLWVVPHLLVTECASALRRKVVSGALSLGDAIAALAILARAVDEGFVTFGIDSDVVSSALTLAVATAHKVPDCMYLALAEREGLSLATADIVLARIAERRGLSVLFVAGA